MPHLSSDTQQPADFHKYLTFSSAQAVLENRTLRWATPGTFNDPYDLQFDLLLDVDAVEVIERTLGRLYETYLGTGPATAGKFPAFVRVVGQKMPGLEATAFNDYLRDSVRGSFSSLERNLPRMNQEIREGLKTTKLLCLTSNPAHVAMWAYYAEDHKGAVFTFQNVPALDSVYSVARAVSYVDVPPNLATEDALADILSGRLALRDADILEHMVYTKGSPWAHESEWRIFSGDGRNRDADFEYLPFAAQELKSVSLGCRMSMPNQSVLIALIREHYPQAKIQRAKTTNKSYSLEFEEVNA